MKITNITESGSNNILCWAIKNGASVFTDEALKHLINDELGYRITIDDVNFFQLFRLTQLYRNELRIRNIDNKIPDDIPFKDIFPGEYTPEGDGHPIELYKLAEYNCNQFNNLALQMAVDSDIIGTDAGRLFTPMIQYSYQIDIPINFIDFIKSMTDDEAKALFSSSYPNTLQDIVNDEHHHVMIALISWLIPVTGVLKYDKRYEKYIKFIKYTPLKNIETNKLYKFAPLSFKKHNRITRSDIVCNLFNSNTDFENNMKLIAKSNEPLLLDFVIELPIIYMQILENIFTYDELPIIYESSMSDIIDGGITYNDYKYPDSSEDGEVIDDKESQISAYQVRITEANQNLIAAISMLLSSASNTNPSDAFSLLPSIYKTKAVVTIDYTKFNKYKNISYLLLTELFSEMEICANGIASDLISYK